MFTDRDIAEDPERVEEALKAADAFFASLVFDYDQVRALALLSRVRRRRLRKPRGFQRFPHRPCVGLSNRSRLQWCGRSMP